MTGVPIPHWKSYGQRAYEAYYTGVPEEFGAEAPAWGDLSSEHQARWQAAARAVISGEVPSPPASP